MGAMDIIGDIFNIISFVFPELKGISFLSKILRVESFFKKVNDIKRLKTVLSRKDIQELTLKSKKVKDYVLNQLFNLQLKSNHFIFFSEEDLKNFVMSRDPDARILKLIDLKEVSLYLVEGRIFSNKWSGLLNMTSFFLLLNQMNLFLDTNISYINEAYNNLYDSLEKWKNDELKKIEELKNTLLKNIIDKLEECKELDIQNTYCLRCSCCCGCDKGSCCCSCECNLIHYIESWNILKNYIQNEITNEFKTFENEINNEFKNYEKLLKDILINKENDKSLISLFIALFDALMKFFFLRVKEKYLFAVLKEKEIINEYKKELHKTGALRYTYEFLKSKKGKYDYEKLIYEELKYYLHKKTGKWYKKNQLRALLAKVKKSYMEKKIYTYSINNKKYIIIV